MKVYNLLKQLDDPVEPVWVYGRNGTLLFKGVLNNVPWHIARCDIYDTWLHNMTVTVIVLES